MSNNTEFAVLYGHGHTNKFPAQGKPVAANNGVKKAASQFLARMPGQSSTDLERDLIEALKSAKKLSSKRKVIIYVGDGALLTNGRVSLLNKIRSLNREKIQINTIGVSPYRENERFLKYLAAQNGDARLARSERLDPLRRSLTYVARRSGRPAGPSDEPGQAD